MARCKLQIIRDDGVGKADEVVDVVLGERVLFDLAPGELKSVFLEVASGHVVFRQAGRVLLATDVAFPPEQRLKLSVRAIPRWGFLRFFLRPKTVLVEEERAGLPPPQPTLETDLTHQFWLGRADVAEDLYRMMGERTEYYSEDNQDAEGTPDHINLSEFADLMGQESYDHDFVEVGFAKPGDDLETRFAGHSWVNLWAPVIRETVAEEVWNEANAFVLVSVDKPKGRPEYRQIRNPVDAIAPGVELKYIGEISHSARV